MNYKSRPKLRSVKLELDDLLKLTEQIEKIYVENDSGSDDDILLFDIKLNDGTGFEGSSASDIINDLTIDFNQITSILIRLETEKTFISISYVSPSLLGYNIESNSKSDLLSYENEIKKIFKNTTWNWLVHLSPEKLLGLLFLIATPYALLIILGHHFNLINLSSEAGYSESVLTLAAILLLIATLTSSALILPKVYTYLQITDGKRHMGRDLKSDLFKFLGIILSLILIPFMLNWFN